MRVLVAGDGGYIGATFADNAGPDLRNYRVDFGKLVDTFPDLSLRWTVRDGIAELLASYTRYGLTYDDFTSSRFVRLPCVKSIAWWNLRLVVEVARSSRLLSCAVLYGKSLKKARSTADSCSTLKAN